ncbi:hypothetical protein [Vampirovibrio sp.]|uniref:hypothetical protein n=1 Tax=Vampirovibrio sp. TaxID=2717857 RepID=UPI00359347F1
MVITAPIVSGFYFPPQAPTTQSPLTGMERQAALSKTTPQTDFSSKAPQSPLQSGPSKLSGNQKQMLGHVAKGSGLVLSALLLKKLPKQTSSFRLLSTDWKEWAKVLTAIAGLGEFQKAAKWEPPIWLNAMMNVALVTPLVTRFNLSNVIQGVIVAPFVGGLASLNHYLGDKAEQPAQKYLHLSPTVTHFALSAVSTLAGLAILPGIAKAIPQPAKSWPGQNSAKTGTGAENTAARASTGTLCANGCCASLICANDVGQMGSAVMDSYQTRNKERGLA